VFYCNVEVIEEGEKRRRKKKGGGVCRVLCALARREGLAHERRHSRQRSALPVLRQKGKKKEEKQGGKEVVDIGKKG